MSCKKNVLPMPSLAGHFDAPDDYVGHFGWLCGYSADAPFLDDALTRFTRMTAAQRAGQGRIFLAVMLDAGNPPILSTDVPGVAHLLLKKGQPFRLLHAKVALLGFRHRTEPGRWWLRLLVSTGNWTRQTVEESLDLAWRLDVTQKGCEEAADGICCSGYKDVSIQVCSTPRPMGVPVRALLPGSVWRDGWMPAAPGPKRPASLTAGRRPC